MKIEHKSFLSIIFSTLFLFVPLAANHDTSLTERLAAIAAHASMPLKHACRDAMSYLAQSPDTQTLQTIAQHLSSFIARRAGGPVPALELPLEQIVAMLESQEVDIHLHPTTSQSSAKRIMFRTMVELFYTFGSQKLALQHPFIEPKELELSKNPATRLMRYAGHEVWDNRSVHALRAMRIFSNEYINELIPNPGQKKWQEFAELLIPILISQCLAFAVSKNPEDSLSDLGSAIAGEMFARLLVVQLFLKKKDVWYFGLMLVIYFLAFYHSSAGDYVWRKKMKKKRDEGGMAKRARYLHTIWGNKKYLLNVAVDGLSSLAIYKVIDSLAANVPTPHWLLATPVCQKKVEPTTVVS